MVDLIVLIIFIAILFTNATKDKWRMRELESGRKKIVLTLQRFLLLRNSKQTGMVYFLFFFYFVYRLMLWFHFFPDIRPMIVCVVLALLGYLIFEGVSKFFVQQTPYSKFYILLLISFGLFTSMLTIGKINLSFFTHLGLLIIVLIGLAYVSISLLRILNTAPFLSAFIMLLIFTCLLILNGFFFGIIYISLAEVDLAFSFVTKVDSQNIAHLDDLLGQNYDGVVLLKEFLYLSYIGNMPFFSSIPPVNKGENLLAYLPYLERLFGYLFSTIFISYLILGELKSEKKVDEAGKNRHIWFEDENLAKAIGRELYSLTKDPHYLQQKKVFREKELAKIIELQANNFRIQHLAGIKWLTSLRKLHVQNNFIANGEELALLKNLEELNLANNQLTNSDFLKNLLYLEKIDVAKNKLSNCVNLANLKQLRRFNGNENLLKNCLFVKQNKKLTMLELNGNRLTYLPEFKANPKTLSLFIRRNQLLQIPNKPFRYVSATNQLIQTTDILKVGKQLKQIEGLRISDKVRNQNELHSFKFQLKNRKIRFSGEVQKTINK